MVLLGLLKNAASALVQSGSGGHYQSILLLRIKGFRGDFLRKVVAFGFLDNRSQRLAVLVGQIADPRQVCQKWSERPVAKRLDQRPEPPADKLVTIQHRDKPVHEQRAIAATNSLASIRSSNFCTVAY